MGRSIRLLVCLSMLGTAACVPDAVTGPEPTAVETEAEAEVQKASDAAAPAEASTARPPGPPSILLRGARSVSVDRDPIYIIDGVIVEKDALKRLDPADIEEIEVVRGASLTPFYGNRLDNGVVQITTRGGRARR
jgi:TonB-dependent starch-binding outer membrane protein SusC